MVSRIERIAGLPDETRLLEDAGWRDRVARLPPDTQDEILDRVDELRGCGERERRIAVVALAALHERLDPRDADDCERIRWLVSQFAVPPPQILPLLHRTADLAHDESLRLRAMVSIAAAAESGGDDEAAERAYRRALGAARGSGGWAERAATLALARLYHRHQREFEALVLSRRAAILMERAQDDWGFFLAHSLRAGVLTEIGDVERAWVRLVQTEMVAERLDARRASLAAASLHALRCALFLDAGDAAGALREQQAYDALVPPDAEGPDARRRLVLRAGVMRRLGNLEEAWRLLEAAGPDDGGSDAATVQILEETFLVALLREGLDGARSRVETLLHRVEQDRDRSLWPGWRVALGTRLGKRLLEASAPFEYVRRAYDLAASAALDRVAELHVCVGDLPELSDAEPADFAILAEYRERFQRQQTQMLAAVAKAFEEAVGRGEATLEALGSASAGLLVCAWCERLRSRDGVWMPVLRFLPGGPELRITHGICPACRERVRPISPS